MFESRIFAGAMEKQPVSGKSDANISLWSCEGHARKCVEIYCELANKTTQQLHKVATPCIDDHQLKEEEMRSVGELSKVCSRIVLTCLHLARIGRPDILWSVNKLCSCDHKMDQSMWQTFSTFDLLHSSHMWIQTMLLCGKHSTTMQIRIVSKFWFSRRPWRDLEDSKSTSGRLLCIFGCQTFVPISWICKKQTSVLHSSTEAETVSLDAGVRMDGIPSLDLWD